MATRPSDLAYAVTGHSAQGATMYTGIALVTGTEDRQWLYSAMTRGTDTNLAYAFTIPARPADPQPGTRAAPELDSLRPHPARAPVPYSRSTAVRCPAGPSGPARADRRACRHPRPRRRRTVGVCDPAPQPGQRPTTLAPRCTTAPSTTPCLRRPLPLLARGCIYPVTAGELSHQARWLFPHLCTPAELAPAWTLSPTSRAIPDGRLWLLRDSYAAQTPATSQYSGRPSAPR